MVKYSRKPAVPEKSASSKTHDLHAHFKTTYNVVMAVRGMRLKTAIKYLEDVLDHKQIIGYRKFSAQRHAQCKALKHSANTGRWPEKSVKAVRELLLNLKANCEHARGLDTDKCYISHAVCQRAQKGRRRTYRAHGRVTPYLSSNCHIEFHATERAATVAKADKPVVRLTKRLAARSRLAIGK
jgi:large subunit ribosomal protein L17e